LIQTAEENRLDASVISPFICRFPHHVLMVAFNGREPMVLASGRALNELLDEMQSIHSSIDLQGKFGHLLLEIAAKMLGLTDDMRIA
jgi:hypothetical protein